MFKSFSKILAIVVVLNLAVAPILQGDTAVPKPPEKAQDGFGKKVYEAFGGPIGALMIGAVAVSVITSGIALAPAIIIMAGTLTLIRLAAYADSHPFAPPPATGTKVIKDPTKDY